MLPLYFLPSFDSIGLMVQEKKGYTDFQDGRHGSYLGAMAAVLDFWRNDFSYFYPQNSLYVLPIFESAGLSVQDKK